MSPFVVGCVRGMAQASLTAMPLALLGLMILGVVGRDPVLFASGVFLLIVWGLLVVPLAVNALRWTTADLKRLRERKPDA